MDSETLVVVPEKETEILVVVRHLILAEDFPLGIL